MDINNKIILMLSRKSILYILIIVSFVELVIILYNNIIGFIKIESFANFAIRWVFGSIFASAAAIYLFILDLKFLEKLNSNFPWNITFIKRFLLESLFTCLIGISGAIIVTLIVEVISPYKESFYWVLFINSTIGCITNIIMVIILEALHYYKTTRDAKISNEKLEKENAIIKLETLKSQLNPHFLFNSLNVLSSLVDKDSSEAKSFIDEFSYVYRYTLDVIDKTVVCLKDELDFVQSYFYLQKNRFGEVITLETKIDSSKLKDFVPPLAIQTLLENAFKHNIANPQNPLEIKIFNEENILFITNTYQPKSSIENSKGIGLENLKKRYELICGIVPTFSINGKLFEAAIPLVKAE